MVEAESLRKNKRTNMLKKTILITLAAVLLFPAISLAADEPLRHGGD